MQYFSCNCLQIGIVNNVTYKKIVKGIHYSGSMPTELLNLFLNISEMGRKVKEQCYISELSIIRNT